MSYKEEKIEGQETKGIGVCIRLDIERTENTEAETRRKVGYRENGEYGS